MSYLRFSVLGLGLLLLGGCVVIDDGGYDEVIVEDVIYEEVIIEEDVVYEEVIIEEEVIVY
ncbi:hypothetical protein [Spongorhabdus nitratireducens]